MAALAPRAMSTPRPTFMATDAAGYEQFMERWSQRLAPSSEPYVELARSRTSTGVCHDLGQAPDPAIRVWRSPVGRCFAEVDEPVPAPPHP